MFPKVLSNESFKQPPRLPVFLQIVTIIVIAPLYFLCRSRLTLKRYKIGFITKIQKTLYSYSSSWRYLNRPWTFSSSNRDKPIWRSQEGAWATPIRLFCLFLVLLPEVLTSLVQHLQIRFVEILQHLCENLPVWCQCLVQDPSWRWHLCSRLE